MAEKKWLAVLVEVQEERLPLDFSPGGEYSSLPKKVTEVFKRLAPAGSLKANALYLIDAAQKSEITKELSKRGLNYHRYAVDEHGEVCTLPGCEVHPVTNVVEVDFKRKVK